MKKLFAVICLLLCLTGCGVQAPSGGVAATTAPVAQFATAIAQGTGIAVTQVISDSVSCLHDYSLSVRQMEVLSNSDLVLCSGAGLEDFMEDALRQAQVCDCSVGVELIEKAHGDHSHADPHIWLDPDRAALMAENICAALTEQYPEHEAVFSQNCAELTQKLHELGTWGREELADCERQIITFHDGFSYLAEAFGLTILASVEEESGSEASAADLTKIVSLVKERELDCVFTEVNGSNAAASVIAAETGAESYALDTAMSRDYFEAMEANILILKEALQ